MPLVRCGIMRSSWSLRYWGGFVMSSILQIKHSFLIMPVMLPPPLILYFA